MNFVKLVPQQRLFYLPGLRSHFEQQQAGGAAKFADALSDDQLRCRSDADLIGSAVSALSTVPLALDEPDQSVGRYSYVMGDGFIEAKVYDKSVGWRGDPALWLFQPWPSAVRMARALLTADTIVFRIEARYLFTRRKLLALSRRVRMVRKAVAVQRGIISELNAALPELVGRELSAVRRVRGISPP